MSRCQGTVSLFSFGFAFALTITLPQYTPHNSVAMSLHQAISIEGPFAIIAQVFEKNFRRKWG